MGIVVSCSSTNTILSDSQSAKELVGNEVINRVHQHTDLAKHFVRDVNFPGDLPQENESTSGIVADKPTKMLELLIFRELLDQQAYRARPKTIEINQ